MDNPLEKLRPEGFKGQLLYRVPEQVLRRIQTQPFTRHFIVSCFGYFPPTQDHLVKRPFGLSDHILIFVENGDGWASLDGVRKFVRAGDVICLPPGTDHAYGSSSEGGWSLFWFHFRGTAAEELLEWTDFSKKRFVLACGAREGIRRQFHNLFSALEGGYHDHALLEMSRVLINVMVRLHRNPLREKSRAAHERIELSMAHMRKTLAAPLSLTAYARHAGYSLPRFCHWFKYYAGVSAMSYLNEVRIHRACELLDNTSLEIKEIAYQLGYNDPLYFSRAFKKCTGMSPSGYKETQHPISAGGRQKNHGLVRIHAATQSRTKQSRAAEDRFDFDGCPV